MEIFPIFTEQNDGVYAILRNGDDEDILSVLQDKWRNPEYVYQFFKDNVKLLNKYHKDFTVQEAALKTLEDAEELFNQLEEYANTGFESNEQNLSDFFTPLHRNEVKLPDYQASKAYGVKIKDSWLRLYAVRLNFNCYIITGGGIKLVRAMQDVPYLAQELEYIKQTQDYLEEQGIIYPEDLTTDE